MVNLIIAEVIIKNVPKNKKIRKMLLRPAKNSKQYFFERKNPQNSKPFYFCSTSFLNLKVLSPSWDRIFFPAIGLKIFPMDTIVV
jgi:hypothetical protein